MSTPDAEEEQPFVRPPSALESDERQLDPFPWYQEMRETEPGIYYDEERDRYEVFSWDAVRTVLEDWETFSSATELPTDRMNVLDQTIFNVDPPRHAELRNAVDDFFRPSRIESLEPRIRELTDDLLDEVDDGEMDVVADLAFPLPIIVIAELLGVPEEDRDEFKSWCDSLTRIRTSNEDDLMDTQMQAGQEMVTYLYEIIEDRREDPQDDLISRIVHADVDGEPMNYSEIMGFPALLLIAGNITTTGLITNAVRTFSEEDPSLFEDLAGDDDALDRALEEVARYQSSVPAVSRVVSRDDTVLGTDVEEGKSVVVWLASANRDPERFDAPDEFRPTRSPNPHIGFGHGVHNCLGGHLARLEARVAVSAMLERFDDVSVDRSDLDPIWNTFMHGVEDLTVEFEA